MIPVNRHQLLRKPLPDARTLAQCVRYSGKAYRVGEWTAINGQTVADLLHFEEEELGNRLEDMQVNRNLLTDLEKYPARKARWVTLRIAGVLHYGSRDEVDTYELEDAIVVANDGDGGFLILLGD